MLLEILYDALRSPFGVVVKTSDPHRLRQLLYPIRAAHLDEFESLTFILDPIVPEYLWVCKKENPDAPKGKV